MGKNINTDCEPINPELVQKVCADLPSHNHMTRAAAFFKVVGDETRMKILTALSQSEMCVNDIAVVLDMTKSAVSHQLKLLRENGLVKGRRDGKNIYYSLDDQHVVDVIDVALTHIGHKIEDGQL